jgi:hypothetical protein
MPRASRFGETIFVAGAWFAWIGTGWLWIPR